MLLKTVWLTLDPYQRSTFMKSQRNVGETIVGGTVSEVLVSKADGWAVGDLVVGYYGWCDHSIGKATDVQWGMPNWPVHSLRGTA